MIALDILKRITSHPLNSGAKASALVRFVKWQIASRLLAGDVVYEWVNGSKFLVRAGETGLTGNVYSGLDEFSDMSFLLHVLRPKDLFVDVGANVGSYSILAGRAVGAAAFAFEPVPATYKRLLENMRLNHLDDKVKCLNIGIGATEGTVAFTSDLDTENHAIAEGEVHKNTVNISIKPLDDLLHHENPALLKIDVEGYETLALEGARATFEKKSLHSVIMELNGSASRYGFQESKILGIMFGNGFETYKYDPLGRHLVNLNGKHMSVGNTIFVRNKSAVLDRLANAPEVNLLGKRF